MFAEMAAPITRWLRLGLATVLVVGGVGIAAQNLTASPARAAGVAVFDSIPAVTPSSTPSHSFGGNSTTELGHFVQLAGTDRHLEDVTVSFKDYACQVGTWNAGDCVTAPGSTYLHPVTVNLYAASGDQTDDNTRPGALLATLTQDVVVPFRPSADPVNCTGGNLGWWFDGTACQPGISFLVTFVMGSLNVTLPDDLIMAVAYNTNLAGVNPINAPGPYDQLNLEQGPSATTVGTDPVPGYMYFNNPFAGNYTDGGAAGVGVLRVDSGWSPPSLVFRITASTSAAAAPGLPATGSGMSVLIGLLGAVAFLFAGGLLLARRAVAPSKS